MRISKIKSQIDFLFAGKKSDNLENQNEPAFCFVLFVQMNLEWLEQALSWLDCLEMTLCVPWNVRAEIPKRHQTSKISQK